MRNCIFFLNLPENTCIINYLVTNHLLSPSPKQKFWIIISIWNITVDCSCLHIVYVGRKKFELLCWNTFNWCFGQFNFPEEKCEQISINRRWWTRKNWINWKKYNSRTRCIWLHTTNCHQQNDHFNVSLERIEVASQQHKKDTPFGTSSK